MTICKTRISRDYTKAIKRHKAVLMSFDCLSARGRRGLEIALFYGYNQLIAGKYLVITAAYGAGLIREDILAVRCFN